MFIIVWFLGVIIPKFSYTTSSDNILMRHKIVYIRDQKYNRNILTFAPSEATRNRNPKHNSQNYDFKMQHIERQTNILHFQYTGVIYAIWFYLLHCLESTFCSSRTCPCVGVYIKDDNSRYNSYKYPPFAKHSLNKNSFTVNKSNRVHNARSRFFTHKFINGVAVTFQ